MVSDQHPTGRAEGRRQEAGGRNPCKRRLETNALYQLFVQTEEELTLSPTRGDRALAVFLATHPQVSSYLKS